jgi:uncharacterized protein
MALQLRVVDGDYAVSKLDRAVAIPAWADGEGFVSISRSTDELSIVCLTARVPISDATVHSESGWVCLQLVGPFAFTLTGILLAVLKPLAAAEIGIFAVSTFDTDYVMVKHEHLTDAIEALTSDGHFVN